MNLGTSAVLLGKAPRVLPSEDDLPSLPTIDLKKKRKQAKPGPSLPPSASILGAQQRGRDRGRGAATTGAAGKQNRGGTGTGGGWSATAAVWKTPAQWWGGGTEKGDAAAGRGAGGGGGRAGESAAGAAAAAGRWLSLGAGKEKGAADGQAEGADTPAAAKGELGELLALCRRIESECLLQQEDREEAAKGKEKESEFEVTKNKIEEILSNTRFLIDARNDIRSKKGTTLETVRLGGEIHDNIALLRELFNQLSATYARLFKQRKVLRLSDEQLELQHADVCRLMRAIEEIRRDSRRVAAGVGAGLAGEGGSLTRIKTLTELQQQQSGGAGGRRQDGKETWGGAGAAAAGGDGRVGRPAAPEVVSEEDMAVIKRWKERDAEFDKQVAEIGDAIDRIADVTAQIGEKAELQHELIQQVQQQTDKTTAELQQVTQKVKDVIGQQSNMTFFTRLFLVVILVFLICFVISVIYSRYIKN